MSSHDDDLCVCFHVSRRKIITFLRLNNPQVPSQCSECYGAGTGCGWCIPFIEELFEKVKAGESDPEPTLSHSAYIARRKAYLRRLPQPKPQETSEPPLADELEIDLLDDDFPSKPS